jgi:hypothetical protein
MSVANMCTYFSGEEDNPTFFKRNGKLDQDGNY